MVKEVEKWWNEAAPRFQEWAKLSTESADYGPYAPRENQLRLLGNIKGKKSLKSAAAERNVPSVSPSRVQYALALIFHKPN